PGRVAVHADRGPGRVAARAGEAGVVLDDRRVADLTAGDVVARPAEQETGPTLAVEHAHHPLVPRERRPGVVGERIRQDRPPGRGVALVDHHEDGPAGALDTPTGAQHHLGG